MQKKKQFNLEGFEDLARRVRKGFEKEEAYLKKYRPDVYESLKARGLTLPS